MYKYLTMSSKSEEDLGRLMCMESLHNVLPKPVWNHRGIDDTSVDIKPYIKANVPNQRSMGASPSMKSNHFEDIGVSTSPTPEVPVKSITSSLLMDKEKESHDDKKGKVCYTGDEEEEEEEEEAAGGCFGKCIDRAQCFIGDFYVRYKRPVLIAVAVICILLYGAYFIAIIIHNAKNSTAIIAITCVVVVYYAFVLVNRRFGRRISKTFSTPAKRLHKKLGKKRREIISW